MIFFHLEAFYENILKNNDSNILPWPFCKNADYRSMLWVLFGIDRILAGIFNALSGEERKSFQPCQRKPDVCHYNQCSNRNYNGIGNNNIQA